jgi:mannose-6-phosphate isomerase-like protein (cupin superfamily)
MTRRLFADGFNLKAGFWTFDMTQQKNWKLIASFALFITVPAVAEDAAMGTIKSLSSVRFSPDKDVKCLSSALETGDPTRGPSTFILKAPPGCVVPWHYHTAEEQLIIISGRVLAEMPGHPSTRLGAGGFAMMESHMPHQFTCQGTSPCVMIVAFDRAYDIYWGKGG